MWNFSISRNNDADNIYNIHDINTYGIATAHILESISNITGDAGWKLQIVADDCINDTYNTDNIDNASDTDDSTDTQYSSDSHDYNDIISTTIMILHWQFCNME